MTTLQKRLPALFSPGRSLIGEREEELRPKGLFGGREWIVPRSECQYRRQDFSLLPARQRAAAARLALARFEPSSGARTHLAWTGGVAHYWIWTPQWDGAEALKYRRWLPESVLHAPPSIDGVRLVCVSEGTEGQIWCDGSLQASQWWADMPGEQAWRQFIRAGGPGVQDGMVVPEPIQPDWLDTPWADSRNKLAIDADAGERIAWGATLLLFACALGWQLSSLARWQLAAGQERDRLAEARERAGPLMDARERAEAAAASIDSLLQLQRGVSDYQMMADVIDVLPDGAQLMGWDRDPARLRILVRSTETDPRRFIEAFAATPALADLTATPSGGGNMLLEFELPDRGAPGVGQ